jgi:hypothetical protein
MHLAGQRKYFVEVRLRETGKTHWGWKMHDGGGVGLWFWLKPRRNLRVLRICEIIFAICLDFSNEEKISRHINSRVIGMSKNQLELATCRVSLLDVLAAMRQGSRSMYSDLVSNGEFVLRLVQIIFSQLSL